MKRIKHSLILPALLLIAAGLYQNTYAVGALFARPRFSSQEYKTMWIKKVDATINFQDQIAVTHLDQVFYNELHTSVEAIYIFPLPENATITQLVYWVNGERFEAQIRERQQAVNDYNQKLRQWLDPALLEYLGNNLFRLSIVPINADTEVRTEITYVEPLKYDMGTVQYKFGLNTLGLSSQPLETVSVSIDAQSQYDYKSFTSPTHYNSTAASITEIAADHYKLFFGDENFYPDKDLIVDFETVRNTVNYNILTYTPSPEDSIGTDSYYALWITPPDDVDNSAIIPQDIVFTADVSSSMEGERLAQVKEALQQFLSLLNPFDKFNIITFGTFVQKFKTDLVPANENNIAEARNFVDQMYALGLTNIDESLTASLQQSYEDTAANDLIFLTDGYPTWGEKSEDSIMVHAKNNNKNDVRIFSFGVGDEVSKSFLTTLSNENHGYARFITSDDSIALVVSDHFKRISKPVLRDITVDFGGLQSWDIYPKTIPDLFWGSQVMLLGRYTNSGNFNVTLKGYERKDSVEYVKSVTFADTAGGHKFVPRIWAKAKIDNILALIAMYGETDELVNQIIELSLKYQILTPYTAFYVDPNPTDIKTDDEKLLPKDFVLSQNYPNPFNPETKITYTLPAASGEYFVTLKIYNSLGELVRVLISKNQAPGIYSVIWDGKDNSGNILPSGVYFYKLEAGNFNSIKKMILMR